MLFWLCCRSCRDSGRDQASEESAKPVSKKRYIDGEEGLGEKRKRVSRCVCVPGEQERDARMDLPWHA